MGGCSHIEVLKIGSDLCGSRGCGGGWYQLRIWGVGGRGASGRNRVRIVASRFVLTLSERRLSVNMTQTFYN